MDCTYGMRIWGSPTWLAIGLSMALLVPAARAVSYEAALSFWNRDVAEGIRDDGKGGFSLLEAGAEWHGLSLGLEYLQALRENYNEVHLTLGYGFELGPVEIGFGVTRVDFSPGSDEDTWELSGELEVAIGEWLAVFIDGMVDVDDVKGGFVETGISLTPPAFGPGGRLAVEPYTLIGWDIGHVSGPRRISENHWQVGLELAGVVTDHIEVFAEVSHSRPLTNLDREGESDNTWAGAGLRMAF